MAPADNAVGRILALVEGMAQQMQRGDRDQSQRIHETEEKVAEMAIRVAECAAKHDLTAQAMADMREAAAEMRSALTTLVGLQHQGRGVALTLVAVWGVCLVLIGAYAQAWFPHVFKGQS
jgi:hypothetical protein